MGVIFTVIGIIYIIYKCFQEEPDTSLSIVKSILFIIIGGVVPSWMIISGNEDLKPFGGIIFFVSVGIEGLIYWAISNNIRFESKSKQEEINEQVEKRLDNIMQEFEDAGYHINEFHVSIVKPKVEWTKDVIRREHYWVPMYDYKEDRFCTIDEIYMRYSKLQHYDLQSFEEPDLSKFLRADIESLPLNQNITKADVHKYYVAWLRKHSSKGEIELRRIERKNPIGVSASQIKEEAIRQRKELAIKYILEIWGLAYQEIIEGELPTNQGYLQQFDQKLRQLWGSGQ